MTAYQVFEIRGSKVADATVSKLPLKGAGVVIPAILVGEAGRGRVLGAIPVSDLASEPCQHWGREDPTGVFTDRYDGRESPHSCRFCGESLVKHGTGMPTHPDKGEVLLEKAVSIVEIGTTKAGKPKLWARPAGTPTTTSEVIVVLRSDIGFRGGNEHTGDRTGWRCRAYGCHQGIGETPSGGGDGPAPDKCPNCGNTDLDIIFGEFPGKILAKGIIAQGDAGRSGSGTQLVAIVPRDKVFRVGMSGRLYGGPAAYYYVWTGEKLLAATWEERQLSDVF